MKKAIKKLFKKGDNNLLKIFLLGLGLAASLTLIAKVYFEISYDNCVPDIDNIYIIEEKISTLDETGKSRDRVPGALSQGVKEYSPLVEKATKYTWLSQSQVIEYENGKKVKSGNLILADSTLFEILPRNIIAGSTREGLAIKGNMLISKTLADKLIDKEDYTQLIGKKIKTNWQTLTIGGVFEDYPRNSRLFDNHCLVSMISIGMFMYDGTNNWVGNDRYCALVKLYPNADLTQLENHINKMCEDNLPHERLEKAGVKLDFSVKPLNGDHLKQEGVKEPIIILLIISLILLFASIFNYVLITISAMVRKAKTMAVLRCYGATDKNIYKIFLSEALSHLLCALILATFIIYTLKGFIYDIFSVTVQEIFSGNCYLIIIGISTTVLLIGGLLPGYLYSKIPVATAFKGYKERTRKWKYILLFIQFASSMIFITLLFISILQYRMMLGAGTGYEYNNLVYSNLSALEKDKKIAIKNYISKLSYVDAVTLTSNIPMHGYSGNNVSLPNDEKDYFNIADQEYVGEGFLELFNIPLVRGRNFNESISNNREIMVSESFDEKLSQMKGWDDGVLGKEVHISAYEGYYTICGIYKDFVIGNHLWKDRRPSVAFLANDLSPYIDYTNILIIKLKSIDAQSIDAVKAAIDNIAPDKEIEVLSYANEYENSYIEYRKIKDSVLIAGIIVLLITVIGLAGYSKDEIEKRRSEVAVRKINGATLSELLSLFIKQILKLSIPAIIIGGIIAFVGANYAHESLANKIDLSWWIFLISGITTIAIVVSITILSIIKTANANPIENLKSE